MSTSSKGAEGGFPVTAAVEDPKDRHLLAGQERNCEAPLKADGPERWAYVIAARAAFGSRSNPEMNCSIRSM